MSFLDEREAQGVKGAVHGAVLTLAIMTLIYNVAAYRVRPERHHLVNIASFSWLCLLESINIWRHHR